MEDIHNYTKNLTQQINCLKNSQLSPKNKEIITQFYDDCALQGLSKPRLIRLIITMRQIGQTLNVDFDKATIEDIKRIVRLMDDKEWSVYTKATYKKVLKKFYKWLKGNNEEYPPEVKWMKTNPKAKDIPIISSQDLITQEEIKKVIDVCDHPRNKAFLSLLAESGCRIGEIGTLLIKNINFDKYGTILSVHGKTGSRQIRVISTTPYISTWLSVHPFKNNPNAPVWINVGSTNNHKSMKYNAFTKIIRDAFSKADIKKRCNPHIFRHSRATFSAKHMTEFQMKQYFGWSQGSDTPSTYVHLSGKDLDQTILKMNGFEIQEKEDITSKPKICPRCNTINTNDTSYCIKCAAILDQKTILESQKQFIDQQSAIKNSNTIMNALMQDQEVQKFLAEKILTLGLREMLLKPPQ